VTIERLSRLDDPRLADYHHLREPSRRMGVERARGIFIVEGRLSVEALVASSYAVRSVLVTEEHEDRLERAFGPGVPLLSLPASAMAEVTGVHFHRGVLAAGERAALPSVADLVATTDRVLVLEAINDHENVGALFRNAAAFGVGGVVLDPTTADPLYRRATRVSLGHVLRVPFARAERWPGVLDDLRAAGFTTLALAPDAAARPFDPGSPPRATPLGAALAEVGPRVALLVGAEGDGLSAGALAAADLRVRIPMAAGVDSVNVATAAAIALAAHHGLG